MTSLRTCLQILTVRMNRFLMPFLWVYLTTGLAVVIAASEIERRANFAGTLQKLSLLVTLASLMLIVIGLVSWVFIRALREDLWSTTQLLMLTTAFSFVVLLGSTHATTSLSLQSAQQVQIGDGFVAINGATSPRLTRELTGLLHHSLKIERVHLSNPGGSVSAAVASARLLRGRGVQVAVIEGDCASACAIMALHFPRRYLADGAALGLHDLHNPSRTDTLAEDRAALMASFRAEGLPVDLLNELMSGRQMNYPTRAVLLDSALVTGCWNMADQKPAACNR